MRKMDEREHMQRLADEGRDTVEMLSSPRKSERERRVVAAFLRCLGVDFRPDELIASESDPPDVIFRDACFEVMILLDKGRKMHADWKRKANQRDRARSLRDLFEPYHPSVPIPFREVVSLATAELVQKASHYGLKTCSQLDALVYINLLGKHLSPPFGTYVPEGLQAQGWRSVCFLLAPYSHVLSVTARAPVFLRRYEGKTSQKCQDPDMMFDL